MPRTFPKGLLAAIVLIVTACVYLPALGFGFVFDDRGQIVETAFALTWKWIPRYFTSHLWGLDPHTLPLYYRPAFMLWLLANYQMFGLAPAWWHLTSIAAHVLCTLLVYVLARRFMEQLPSAVAALVFGIHPVHAEAVSWVSAVNEPLLGIFFVGAILAYLHWRDTRRPLWLAASALLYALAMLEKETAVVLPGVILACELLFPKTDNRRGAAVLSLYGALTIAYLLVRQRMVPGLMTVLKPLPFSIVVSTWPAILSFYLKQLVWPVRMSEFYEFPPVAYLSVTRLVLPLVLLGVIAFLLWKWSTVNRAVAFSCVLMILPILPVLDFRAFAANEVVHDRYLYVPSIGFCLLLGLIWNRLVPRIWLVPLVALLGIAGWLGYRTVTESGYWKDDVTLFRRAVEVAPGHPMSSENLATALLMRGKPADALPYFDRALALGSQNPETLYGMGRVYFFQEDWDRAAVCFKQALDGGHTSSRYLLYAGLSDFRRGRLNDAESELRQALQARAAVTSDLGLYHASLGEVLEKRGDLDQAAAEYRAELVEDPNSESAKAGLLRVRR